MVHHIDFDDTLLSGFDDRIGYTPNDYVHVAGDYIAEITQKETRLWSVAEPGTPHYLGRVSHEEYFGEKSRNNFLAEYDGYPYLIAEGTVIRIDPSNSLNLELVGVLPVNPYRLTAHEGRLYCGEQGLSMLFVSSVENPGLVLAKSTGFYSLPVAYGDQIAVFNGMTDSVDLLDPVALEVLSSRPVPEPFATLLDVEDFVQIKGDVITALGYNVFSYDLDSGDFKFIEHLYSYVQDVLFHAESMFVSDIYHIRRTNLVTGETQTFGIPESLKLGLSSQGLPRFTSVCLNDDRLFAVSDWRTVLEFDISEGKPEFLREIEVPENTYRIIVDGNMMITTARTTVL